MVSSNIKQDYEHYRMIFENNQFVMLLIDPQTGKITNANQAALNYYGYSFDEMCGKNIAEINTLPEPEVKRQMAKAKNKTQSRFIFKHRLANGIVRDVEVHSGPVNTDGQSLIYSIIHDITTRLKTENALTESEVKFRKYIEFAPHGVFVTDRNCICLEANPAAGKITGYSIDELTSKNLFQLIPAHARELAQEKFMQVITEGLATCVLPFLRKDGSERYFSIDAVKLSEKRFLGNVIDITQRIMAERALQESEKLQRESQAAGNIGSYSVNLVTRRWMASDELYRIFGITTEHPNTIQTWIDTVHPQFRDDLLEELFRNTSEKNTFEHEYKILRVSDGAERWVSGKGKFDFENHQKVRLIGTVQDITERKLAEEKLKSLNDRLKQLNEELEERVTERAVELMQSHRKVALAEEKYRTIANYNYNLETWMNPSGEFIYVSPSCLRITGYSSGEFISQPQLFYKIAHPDDRQMVKEYFIKSQKGHLNEVSFDFRIRTKSGEERWLSHYCCSVHNNEGKWLGQRGSSSDITDRKQVEKNLIESQSKLRTLTRYINELAEKERITIAREIHDELGHMLTALKYDMHNMLEEKNISSGKVKTQLPVMIGMVESLIESVRKIATELRPGILDHLGLFPAIEWQVNQFRMMTRMSCDFISSHPDVTFNKEEISNIYRIFQEVLTNVARHSRAKKVTITIDKKNDQFRLSVIDNGIGFDSTTSIKSNSPGLIGMQERALAIGGQVKIDSTPGKGTTVTFLLHK